MSIQYEKTGGNHLENTRTQLNICWYGYRSHPAASLLAITWLSEFIASRYMVSLIIKTRSRKETGIIYDFKCPTAIRLKGGSLNDSAKMSPVW